MLRRIVLIAGATLPRDINLRLRFRASSSQNRYACSFKWNWHGPTASLGLILSYGSHEYFQFYSAMIGMDSYSRSNKDASFQAQETRQDRCDIAMTSWSTGHRPSSPNPHARSTWGSCRWGVVGKPMLVDCFKLSVCQSADRYRPGLLTVLDGFEVGADYGCSLGAKGHSVCPIFTSRGYSLPMYLCAPKSKQV